MGISWKHRFPSAVHGFDHGPDHGLLVEWSNDASTASVSRHPPAGAPYPRRRTVGQEGSITMVKADDIAGIGRCAFYRCPETRRRPGEARAATTNIRAQEVFMAHGGQPEPYPARGR